MLVHARPIAVPGSSARFISLSSKTGFPRYFPSIFESTVKVFFLSINEKASIFSVFSTTFPSLPSFPADFSTGEESSKTKTSSPIPEFPAAFFFRAFSAFFRAFASFLADSAFFSASSISSVTILRLILSRHFSKLRTPASRAYSSAIETKASFVKTTCSFASPFFFRFFGIRYFLAISIFS